jgi:hypothetical protein
MTKNLKLPVYLACLVAPCLLTTTAVPSLADETYTLKNIINMPDGQILGSFDISFVSPSNHTFALSVSRTNASGLGSASGPAALIVDTQFNIVVKEIGTGVLTGACDIPPGRDDFSGPNGMLVVEKGRNADVWVGDGPVYSPSCAYPGNTHGPMNTTIPGTLVTKSSVKVFDLETGALKKSISTGGQGRADELCYNPRSDVVLIANDSTVDSFITFIGEDSLDVIQHIKFDGSDANANHLVANGIEQCAFNQRDGKFYINLPNTATVANPAATNPGVVLRISGEAPFHVEAVFSVDPSCGGASGLAIGPGRQIGLACAGAGATPGAEIMDDRNGGVIALLRGENGADEMWYDPGSNHYFFGVSGSATTTPPNIGHLGVVDAGPPPSLDTTVNTASGSHSVAANLVTNEVYVPIRSSVFGAASVCSSGKDVFGKSGNDAAGCIAVYTSARDAADCVPEGVPVISVGTDGNPIYKKDRCHNH